MDNFWLDCVYFKKLIFIFPHIRRASEHTDLQNEQLFGSQLPNLHHIQN